jgi:nitrous oxidase accessory protein
MRRLRIHGRIRLAPLAAGLLAAGFLAGSPAAAAASAAPEPVRTAAREIVVDPGGPVTTLAEALGLARAGDRITVRAGHYREGPLTVAKPVSIVGEGEPVLDGEGRHGVLRVTADGVTIRGLVLANAGVSFVADHAALLFEGVSGCTVEDNRLEDNFFGIYLARVRGCRVAGNEIRGSETRQSHSGNGVHLWNATDVEIEGNVIEGHRDGIYLEFAGGARIRGNRAVGNLRYGLHFMFSNDSFYEENLFARNSAGVAIMYTRNIEMRKNRFEDNWGTAAYGLLLKEIADSRVIGNEFRRNTVGIFSEGSDRIRIEENRFVANGWAVKIFSNSQDNVFTRNDFVDNSFDVTTNSRRNPSTFLENYWSRYEGYDLTADGFGDVPHRPVRLFSLLVERHPTALLLLRSVFVELLEVAERVMPVLTPETLVDERPRMREWRP